MGVINMEIETYEEKARFRTKVFLKIKDGNIFSILVGNDAIPTEQGFQLYVDDYVAEQIDKCELYFDGLNPKLRLKEGETLEIPTEVEAKEREIKELEQRLKQLRGDDHAE